MSYRFAKDSLNIRLGVGFDKDLVCIYINGKEEVSDTLITDPRLDFAGSFNFGSLSNIKTVGIKINNDRMEKINLKNGYRFMYFDFFYKDTLTVTLSSQAYASY